MLTIKGAATKERIVAGAAAEIRENGVAETTLDDIRRRTATSKSQLFHYFPDGREQLLFAVAEFEAARVLSDQQPYLSQLTSWRAWERWRDCVLERYRGQGEHCPLAVLTAELSRNSPATRELIMRLIAQWQAEITAGVRVMQDRGKIAAALDAERASAAIIAGIQGGVAILMATGSIGHLEAALDASLAQLRQHAP